MQKYDDKCMQQAFIVAKESKCTRLQVGMTISIDGRVVTDSYNGLPEGADDAEVEFRCPDCDVYTNNPDIVPPKVCPTCQGYGVITNPEVQHAERNGFDFCAAKGIAIEGATIHITHAPCIECAKSIISTRIARVVYANTYRKTDGIDYLKKHNVEVEQWKPEQN